MTNLLDILHRLAALARTEQIQVSLLMRQLEAKKLVRDTQGRDYKGLVMQWAKREVRNRELSLINLGISFGKDRLPLLPPRMRESRVRIRLASLMPS